MQRVKGWRKADVTSAAIAAYLNHLLHSNGWKPGHFYIPLFVEFYRS
jgi:hypothetical protein